MAPTDFASLSLEERVRWYVSNAPDADELLERSGYYSAVGRYVDSFDAFAAAATEVAAAIGTPSFSPMPEEYIAFVKSREYAKLSFLGKLAIERVDDVIGSLVLGGSVASSIIEALRAALTGEYVWGDRVGMYSWHIGTYVRTELMRLIRDFVAAQAAKDGISLFMYVGPLDAKTRPFCAHIVGGVFTFDQIEQMQNGQTESVMSDGGGWNCRHVWVPVTAEFAAAVSASPEVVLDAARGSSTSEGGD
jgi:hypothetical protein